MKEVYEVSLLYDFYGELLTEGQQEIMQLYYFDDLSLSEIAQMKEVSRSAVHDLISRTENKLAAYEAHLHLIERFRRQSDRIAQIGTQLDEAIALLQQGQSDQAVQHLSDTRKQIESLKGV